MSNFLKIMLFCTMLFEFSCTSIKSSTSELHIYSMIWSAKPMYILSNKNIIESNMHGEILKKTGVYYDSIYVLDSPLFFNMTDSIKKIKNEIEQKVEEQDIRIVCLVFNSLSNQIDTLSFSQNGYMIYNTQVFKINKTYLRAVMEHLPLLHQSDIRASGTLEPEN